MRKLLLLFIAVLGFIFAETPVKGNAYIISSMNVNAANEIQKGQTYSLVPKVVVYNGEDYVGSVTPYTGCIDSNHYTNGVLDTGWKCMVGLVNDLTTGGADKALSAEQGKVLNEKFYRNVIKPKESSRWVGDVNFQYKTEGYWIINGRDDKDNRNVNFADVEVNERMKFVGIKSGSVNTYGIYAEKDGQKYYALDENGIILEPGEYELYMYVKNGIQCNDVIVKPMVTDKLDATYDDFISYLDNYEKNRDTRIIKNYFRPTAKTEEKTGITLTNNGDGTYTANGTATTGTTFILGYPSKYFNTVKIIGIDDGGSHDTYGVGITSAENMYTDESYDSGGSIWHNTYAYQYYFYVREGITITNLTIKPMLTDDTTATYGDWVPAEYQNYIWENWLCKIKGGCEINSVYSQIVFLTKLAYLSLLTTNLIEQISFLPSR